MADGNPEHLAFFAGIGKWRFSILYAQIDKFADVLQSSIAHERAGKKSCFTQNLKTIADADDQTTRGSKLTDLIHDGRKLSDCSRAQVVAVSKAAGHNNGITVFQVMRIMPEHRRLLAGGGNGRVVAILIAIGAGKDDDAKFHVFILSSRSTHLWCKCSLAGGNLVIE